MPTITLTFPNSINTSVQVGDIANLSTVLGYYGEVKFKNSSTIKSELFSIGTDMFVSSK